MNCWSGIRQEENRISSRQGMATLLLASKYMHHKLLLLHNYMNFVTHNMWYTFLTNKYSGGIISQLNPTKLMRVALCLFEMLCAW